VTLSLLRVNVFPGGFNWPLFAGTEKNFFAGEHVAIELQATSGSVAQMTGLAAGQFEIAMTAFDNVVAYAEGQGEAPIGPQPQFFAFLGSDDSFLSLVAKPDISQAQDLRGHKISVDAATTGYAFVLFDLLEQAGLARGDYTLVRIGGMAQRFADLCHGDTAATLLSAPYDLLAEQTGLRVVQRLRRPYQGNVAAARREWAEASAALVTGFIRGYVAAISWLFDPANIPEACAILERNVLGMGADLARASHTRMFAGDGGFFRDGRLDGEGARKVLELRTRYAAQGRTLEDPGKYIDMRYWEQALAP
jgi:ABC-type nitrate/sulfonate/bicarbonate transport system substrate-binding protein